MREILDHKRQRRRELAALPFPEKVRIVEQMRKTVIGIRASTAQSRVPAEIGNTGLNNPSKRGLKEA